LDNIFRDWQNGKNQKKYQDIVEEIDGRIDLAEYSLSIPCCISDPAVFPGLYLDPQIEAHRI
jgi:hypothetical protein